MYAANLHRDLPSPHKRKRVIFYQQGLKIYGLLPYILQKKLKAQFFSGSFASRSGRMVSVLSIPGSLEENWTAIPYAQSSQNLKVLLDWLYSECGFEVALASRQNWEDDIFSPNVFRMPPHTWFPLGGEAHDGFLAATQSDHSRESILSLLALPSAEDAKEEK